MKSTLHRGGCHCGAVQFTVEAPAALDVLECNCSMCHRTGYLHLMVPRTALTLLQGEEALLVYRFNTGVARHLFCRICGIKSFYVPRSHPDGYSVNVRCLEPATITAIRVTPFDGRHWEANAASLAPLPD